MTITEFAVKYPILTGHFIIGMHAATWGEFPLSMEKTMMLLEAWIQFYIVTRSLEVSVEFNDKLEAAVQHTEDVFEAKFDDKLKTTMRTLADGLFQKTSGLDPDGLIKAWDEINP